MIVNRIMVARIKGTSTRVRVSPSTIGDIWLPSGVEDDRLFSKQSQYFGHTERAGTKTELGMDQGGWMI